MKLNGPRATVLIALLQLVVIAVPGIAAILEEERTAAVAYLEETRDAFVAIVESLDEEAIHLRHSPESWSISEIGEHLVKVEVVVYETITGSLLESPERPDWSGDGQPLIRDHVV